MEGDGIVPDVIDVAPKALAKVTYPSGVSVELGNELTPTQVKDQPEVTWDADPDSLYTLAMVDPDAPSRADPKYREVVHWLVVNIPGNKVAEGQTVMEYIGSGPREGTGLHRYIFLIFKQEEKNTTKNFISKTNKEGRVNAKTRDYIVRRKLGNPVAGNYYKAQYDECCKVLHKQFEKK